MTLGRRNRMFAAGVLACAMTATGCGAAGRELAPPATGASVAGPVGGGADRARDVDPALDRQVELRLGAGIDEELVAKATDALLVSRNRCAW